MVDVFARLAAAVADRCRIERPVTEGEIRGPPSRIGIITFAIDDGDRQRWVVLSGVRPVTRHATADTVVANRAARTARTIQRRGTVTFGPRKDTCGYLSIRYVVVKRS